MVRAKTDRWVDKLTALNLLKGMKKGCSTIDYAKALAGQRFRLGDFGQDLKRAWKRAYQVLQRLERQDLIVRIPQGMHYVEYDLRTRGGLRRARRQEEAYTWEITLKGKARATFLQAEKVAGG